MRRGRRTSARREAPTPASPRTAWSRAIGMLARRERSRAELASGLARDGFDEAEIEATLDRLAERRWLDDEGLALRHTQRRLDSATGGRLRIRAELAQRGVTRSTVDAVLGKTLDEGTEARAVDAAARRWWRSHPARSEEQQGHRLARLAGFLQRRGFPGSLVRARLRELFPDQGAGILDEFEWPADDDGSPTLD